MNTISGKKDFPSCGVLHGPSATNWVESPPHLSFRGAAAATGICLSFMKRNEKNIVVGFVGFMLVALPCERVAAWSHANRWGGSTSHSYGSGSTTRTTGWGGSETHTYGQGTTATGRYGDTASHSYGSDSTTFTNPYGRSATHTYGQGTSATSAYGGTAYHAYGSGYTTYHPASGGTYYGSSYDHYYGGNSRR